MSKNVYGKPDVYGVKMFTESQIWQKLSNFLCKTFKKVQKVELFQKQLPAREKKRCQEFFFPARLKFFKQTTLVKNFAYMSLFSYLNCNLSL